MNTISPPPVLAALRQVTGPLHQRLDDLIDLERTTASREAYRHLLVGMLGGLAPVEESLRSFDWVGAGLDAEVASWRSPLLRQDLRALGMDAAEVAAVPLAPVPPMPSTRAEAFGALYVIEGAALGGQLIFRAARDRLGISEVDGGAFHAGSSRPPVGESWRRFRSSLEAHCDRVEAAEALACRTFLELETWLIPLLSPSRSEAQA